MSIISAIIIKFLRDSPTHYGTCCEQILGSKPKIIQ